MRTVLIVPLLFCASHVAVFSQSLGLVREYDFSGMNPHLLQSNRLSNQFLLANRDWEIELIEIQSGRSLRRFDAPPHQRNLNKMTYNLTHFAGASRSEIAVWALSNEEIVLSESNFPFEVRDVDMSESNAALAAITGDVDLNQSRLFIWNRLDSDEQFHHDFDSFFSFVEWIGSDRLFLAGHKKAVIYNSASNEIDLEIELDFFSMRSAALSPDGTLFASRFSLYEVAENGRVIEGLLGRERSVFQMLFSPDSNYLLVSRGLESGVQYWDVDDLTLIRHFEMPLVNSMDFANNQTQLLTVSEGVVKLWNYGPDPQSSAAWWELY